MPLTFHLIPHTHWDREWYLTRAGFQARLVPMMDDLLDRLEPGPDALRFVLDGQAIIAEDYLAVRPDREARLAQVVGRGSLQIGPWYVLADELIPAGESMVRNLLIGRAVSRRFGTEMPVLYSPDAFGHPAGMPRIGAAFGLRHAVLWRGAGPASGITQDLFRWRDRSGSDLLVYHLPRAGYEIGADLPGAGSALPARWRSVRDALVSRAASSQVAVFVGADHHAVHPDTSSLARQLQALETVATVRVSGLDDFFAAIDAEAPAVPVVEGELRWSYGYTWAVQGVHGTRARQKRRHSLVELELTRVTEPLAALAAAVRGLDQRPLLTHAWKQLLQSQFHDTIAGTASDAVAAEQEVRLAGVRAANVEMARRAIEILVGHDPDRARAADPSGPPMLALFNPVPRVRDGVVVAELNLFRRDEPVGPPGSKRPRRAGPFRSITLADGGGRRIPVQVLGSAPARFRADARYHYPDHDVVDRIYVAFAAPAVPGCGVTTLAVLDQPSEVPTGSTTATLGRLSNARVAVELSDLGRFTIVDLETRAQYRGLAGLRCEADRGDAYTAETDGHPLGTERAGPWRITARGPLVVAATAGGEIDLAGHGRIRWQKTVALYADTPVARLRIDLWSEVSGCLVRLALPTGIGGPNLAGAPFGSVERHPVVFDPRDYPAEHPVITAPAQRFVALSDRRRGLAVLAPGFFEYAHGQDGDLAVTLLRAVGELSRNDLVSRPGHAAWPMPIPGAEERGHHSISLGIAPTAGPVRAEPDRLERLWEDFALGCSSWWLGPTTGLGSDGSGLTLDAGPMIATAVKPTEDGLALILRAYNPRSVEVEGCWRFSHRVVAATRVRGDETPFDGLALSEAGTAVRFQAAPHELVSIRIELPTPPNGMQSRPDR